MVDQSIRSIRHERKDAAESRCRILDVAKQLFGRCGVEAVSMHQIAKSAGVGQGTLYRRYADKKDLCADLLLESAAEFLTETSQWVGEALQDGANPVEVLEALIDRIVDFCDDKIELLTGMTHTIVLDDKHIFPSIHALLVTLLEAIGHDNTPLTIDPAFAADLILSAMSPKILLYELKQRGYSKEQFAENVRRIYLYGLLAGFGPNNSPSN